MHELDPREAAYLAGLAVGYWKDPSELARHWALDRRLEPKRKSQEMTRLRTNWARALERAAGWARKGEA